jgi:hypothetical protein
MSIGDDIINLLVLPIVKIKHRKTETIVDDFTYKHSKPHFRLKLYTAK